MKTKLNSILKNVPIELKQKIMEYKTKDSCHSIRWKARQPISNCPPWIRKNYNDSGSLPFEFAQSADLYIDSSNQYTKGYMDGVNTISETDQKILKQLELETTLKEGYKTESLRLEKRVGELYNQVTKKQREVENEKEMKEGYEANNARLEKLVAELKRGTKPETITITISIE